MAEGRPDIPAQLKRDLLVEAGHRCAIPTCRVDRPLEFEHIEDWAKVKKHEFGNMIVLCANCHGRKGNGPGQIDRKSLRQYKANLALLNSRYGELERRLFEAFAENPNMGAVKLVGHWEIPFMYVLKDGLFVQLDARQLGGPQIYIEGMPVTQVYAITEKGREFVARWAEARPLD
ncbi:HNH endonuclease signature motif containing protein [Microbispora rosea]|uniref:HNH endonuclease n=1 Tax=Microbispora rosea TaxID=58117 RepID=UPI003422D63A